MVSTPRAGTPPDRSRDAEAALKRLGYARVPPGRRTGEPEAAFWVQEAGVPRRTFPVYVPLAERPSVVEGIDRWLERASAAAGVPRRAIFVASSDVAAEEAWDRLRRLGPVALEHDVSILVVPSRPEPPREGYFALRTEGPLELLRLATGVVVGLFRRAHAEDGPGAIDFEELLGLLKGRFGIDVHRSLRVESDEDALFLLYQLAQRYAYAPGDSGANLHLLVLKPTGPAARVPWFAG